MTDGTSAMIQRRKPALVAQGALVDHLEARLELPPGADEGQHDVQVRRLFSDSCQHVQLELEDLGLLQVAVGAPVADHRVVLDRLELGAAHERAELVRAEVGGAVHDWSGREGVGHLEERLAQSFDELVGSTLGDQLARVRSVERVGEHELGAEQPDTVDG